MVIKMKDPKYKINDRVAMNSPNGVTVRRDVVLVVRVRRCWNGVTMYAVVLLENKSVCVEDVPEFALVEL